MSLLVPCSFQISIKLVAASQILLGPVDSPEVLGGGGVERPIGIGKMRSRETAQIGASGSDDAIHVVELIDIAYRHSRDAHFVSDPIRERRLEHPSINRLGLDTGLAG